jgi:hypothetical protein
VIVADSVPRLARLLRPERLRQVGVSQGSVVNTALLGRALVVGPSLNKTLSYHLSEPDGVLTEGRLKFRNGWL